MNKQNNPTKLNKMFLVLLVLIWGVLFVACLTVSPKEYSTSERRSLAQFPKVTRETVLSGKFADAFEDYASDQFPWRESFRTIHAWGSRYILGKKDVNDLYESEGYLAKLEPEIHVESVTWGKNRLQLILDKYVTDNKVYFAIVPDKNYYLAENNGYPYLDFDAFRDAYLEGMEKVTYIDLTDTLTLNSYYRTDAHWSQDKLLPVAGRLAEQMNFVLGTDYTETVLDHDFYGLYAGQSALPVSPDTITYYTGKTLEQLVVNCYDTGKAEGMDIYDMDKAYGRDPYEMFLSGSKALITIENPTCNSGRELVIFRDSFGSSLTPLLTCGYEKITLVDIRYLSPNLVGRFVDFADADILFLYSVSVLNNCVGQFIN